MTVFHFRCLFLLSTAQTRAVQDDDKSSEGSKGRTTLDIVWSCLATIFACTWLAVHPNVPSRYMREKGRLFLSLHRVKHMLLAIICPEVVIMWAFRQRLVASTLSKHLELSMTHSFFISMGGFIGKDERPITAADFFVHDSPDNLLEGMIGGGIRSDLDISPILRIPKEELMDKSKGDALSKSISLLQTTWFVVQFFARRTLSLPTTPLETAALAFALLNFCNYILWWHKPLDVQYPLNVPTIPTIPIIGTVDSESIVFSDNMPVLHRSEAPVTSTLESNFNPTSYAYTGPGNSPSVPRHNSTAGASRTNEQFSPMEYDISDFIIYESSRLDSDEWSISLASADNIDIPPLVPVAIGNIVPTAERISPRPVVTGRSMVTESGTHQWRDLLGFHQNFFRTVVPVVCASVWRWHRQILLKILQLRNMSGDSTSKATLPMLWAGPLSSNQTRYIAYFGGCFGALFGGIHCLGWTFLGSFDSSLEQLLWKISSLIIATIPVILALELLFFQYFSWVPLFMGCSSRIFTFIYICARVYLLVDMFVSLRSLPPGALEEIDWTRYIPHI
ncbi:hypothetical protein EDD18DRAFT_595373 [Armillaria luteobubalina]|uniref:Transmembrane protein n=1 Tax=Armillaria luteobubalina TaxID=153913 RepID=A0AA39ULW0_9AGAR|nr:hypothetical protein EDD18DRAFT_595373 [Armillaria luteobubalina]